MGLSLSIDEQLSASAERLHRVHHLEVERTKYLAEKLLDTKVPEKIVEDMVKRSLKCREVDPSPVMRSYGKLEVGSVWYRLAADIIHVGGKPYLTSIGCGPCRYTIWQSLTHETAVLESPDISIKYSLQEALLRSC